MPTSEVRLTTGERIVVEGGLEDVEKQLSDASRSGANRLAWLRERETGELIAVNPGHVAVLSTAG